MSAAAATCSATPADASRDLREKAPDDLADEWETVVFAWSRRSDEALEDAAASSPPTYDRGKPPAGVQPRRPQAIADAAARARLATRVAAGGTAIEQQARDVCKVNLGSEPLERPVDRVAALPCSRCACPTD